MYSIMKSAAYININNENEIYRVKLWNDYHIYRSTDNERKYSEREE